MSVAPVRIIYRYITRELVGPFFVGIGVFTFILLIARILKLVEMVVNRGVPFLQVLRLFSYILPAFLEVTVPMALLLAILVCFGRLSFDSELIALQASGISLYRLMLPVAVFAIFTALGTLGLSAFARPWGNAHLRLGLYEVLKARASAGIRPQVFNDDFSNLVIYVDRIEPPGNHLRGVLISDIRDPSQQNVVFATRGTVIANERSRALTLRLEDGNVYTASTGSRTYQDTRFSTYDITLDLDLAMARAAPKQKDVSEMSIGELKASIEEKTRQDRPTLIERIELHRKLSIPFACLVFAAFGLPLGIRRSRSVHSWGFGVSLALIFLYYLLLTLGQNLGERGRIPPFLAMWLPNLLLFPVGLVLLRRAAHGGERRRSWPTALSRLALAARPQAKG